MCPHLPPWPPADAAGRDGARAVASHPEQGWSLLCNGVILFDDGGQLLPDNRAVPRTNRLWTGRLLRPEYGRHCP